MGAYLRQKGGITMQRHKNNVGNWLKARSIDWLVGEVGFFSEQLWGKCLCEVSLLVITWDYRAPCLP